MGILNDFFLLIGASLFCWGLAMIYGKIKFYRYSRLTLGTVVGYERHERRILCHHPVVVFQVSKNNKIRFKSGVASNRMKYELGEEVPVRYMILDPQKAEINKLWIIWFEPLLCLIFAFILLSLGLF